MVKQQLAVLLAKKLGQGEKQMKNIICREKKRKKCKEDEHRDDNYQLYLLLMRQGLPILNRTRQSEKRPFKGESRKKKSANC